MERLRCGGATRVLTTETDPDSHVRLVTTTTIALCHWDLSIHVELSNSTARIKHLPQVMLRPALEFSGLSSDKLTQ